MSFNMKLDRILLVTLAVIIAGVVGLGVKGAHDAEVRAAIAQQEADRKAAEHEIEHARNERRRKALAFQAHLQRLAFDRAHPEVVAERKREAAARAAAIAEALAERRERAAEQQRIADAAAAEQRSRQDKEDHPCNTADDLENSAAEAINAEEYQKSFDLSVSGMHYADECDNDTDKTIDKGYFLSFKAYAEHFVGSADQTETDYNQANQLLVECQSTPGIYGTPAAARCETQEHNNIEWEQHWEMERMGAE